MLPCRSSSSPNLTVVYENSIWLSLTALNFN